MIKKNAVSLREAAFFCDQMSGRRAIFRHD
jgi:hypothetical protein